MLKIGLKLVFESTIASTVKNKPAILSFCSTHFGSKFFLKINSFNTYTSSDPRVFAIAQQHLKSLKYQGSNYKRRSRVI